MSADKISSKDVFVTDDVFGHYNSGITEAITNTAKLAEGVKHVAAEFIKIGSSLKLGDANSVAAMVTATNDLNNATKAYAGIQTSLAKLEQETEKADQQKLRTAALRKKAVDDLAKSEKKAADDKARADKQAIKDEAAKAKTLAQSQSLYYKLSQQLINMKKASKDLILSGKELSDQDKKLIKDTQELDAKLKHVDAQFGDNQRNVGAYKEALMDISAEMGAFGGLISKVVRTLKTLQEQGEHSATGMQKLGNVMKAAGIAVVLALVAAIAEANNAANEMSEALKRNSEKFDINNLITDKGRVIALAYSKSIGSAGVAGSLEEARAALTGLLDITIEFEAEQRRQRIDLEKLTLDQEEYNQIAGDTTIGYTERITAQKQALELSVKIAAKNKEIALAEFAQAEAVVSAQEKLVGKGNATKEQKDKLNEAALQVMKTEKEIGLVELQNAEKSRQINIEKTNEEIDLILKKRESANAQKQILESQIKDEQKQIDERRSLANKLLTYNKETTAKELEIFKKGYEIKFNSNNLLMEQDAVVLASKIKNLKTLEGHGLGEAGVTELAKIIKQAQEDQISNAKTQQDLDREAIKNKQKIAEIEKEITIIETEGMIKSNELSQKANEDKSKLVDKKIFDRHQVFNRGLINEHKALAGHLNDQNDNVAQNKEDLLNQQAELERQKVKDKKEDAGVEAEEIKKIDTKLEQDVYALHLETANKKHELDQAEIDWNKKLSDERKKIIFQELDETINATEKALTRENNLKEKQLDNDLDMRQRNILQQQQLAIAGKNNTLAFEKAAAAKDELAKQKLAEQEKKREKELAFLKLFAAYAEKGDPDQAASKALIEMGIGLAITNSFAGGIEGLEGPGTETSDSIPAFLSKKESVITAAGTKANPGLATAMNKGAVDEYFEQKYLPKYMTEQSFGSFGENVHNSLLLHSVRELKSEMTEIKKVIENRPVAKTNLNNLGEVVNTKIEKGFVKVRKHKPPQSPLNYI